MSAGSRARFAELVRQDHVDVALACLLVECEADVDLDVDAALVGLDALTAGLPQSGSDAERLRTLLRTYEGDQESFRRLDGSLLSRVLTRRTGLPIMLSVVWLEVARRAGIQAYGASLPGRFVVGVGIPAGPHVLLDPFQGGRYVPEPAPLVPWGPVPTVQRVLTNIRRWADLRPERMRTRLWATELGVLLPDHPAELQRELGVCLARLGLNAEAATALERYAEAVAARSPDLRERALGEARMVRAQLN